LSKKRLLIKNEGEKYFDQIMPNKGYQTIDDWKASMGKYVVFKSLEKFELSDLHVVPAKAKTNEQANDEKAKQKYNGIKSIKPVRLDSMPAPKVAQPPTAAPAVKKAELPAKEKQEMGNEKKLRLLDRFDKESLQNLNIIVDAVREDGTPYKSTILDLIVHYSEKWNVPTDLALAFFYKESHFDPNIKNSRKGAKGIGQMMKIAVRAVNEYLASLKDPVRYPPLFSSVKDERGNVQKNIEGSIIFFSTLYNDTYHQNSTKALGYYNGGNPQMDHYREFKTFTGETKDFVYKCRNYAKTFKTVGIPLLKQKINAEGIEASLL
jgi:soluble lytic murein transglycosylase-like protein